MKKTITILALLLACPMFMWAAAKPFSFECRTKIVRGDHVFYEYRSHNYYFRIEVVSDDSGEKPEQMINGRYPFIIAQPRERYSVRIYNPLPVRVAVNLSIDGLNSITGNPCTPVSGKKWLIEAHSYITISGWQVSKHSLRRFYFTSKEKSYAAWQSNQWGQDLTVRCGMISAAYFLSRREIEKYFERHPIVEEDYDEEGGITGAPRPYGQRDAKKQRSMAESQDAGTGMGEKESHPVHSVDFRYDIGMYQGRQAVKIYYDFSPYSPYGHKRFTPRDPDYAPEEPRDNDDEEE